MTTRAAVTARQAEPGPSHRPRLIAGLTVLVAVGLPVTAILTARARDVTVAPGLIDWLFVAGVAALTIAVFGLLAPWAARTSGRAATTGLTLSVSALVLSVMFFWTMAPVVFGSAGIWLGYTARQAAQNENGRTGAATAAILVGALAALGSVAAYVATS